MNISYPLIRTHSFFGKFGVLSFLETPVLRFALLLLTLCGNPLRDNPTKWPNTLKQFVGKGLNSAQLSKMLLFWLGNLYDLIKSLTYLFIITSIFIILKMQKKIPIIFKVMQPWKMQAKPYSVFGGRMTPGYGFLNCQHQFIFFRNICLRQANYIAPTTVVYWILKDGH